MMERKVDPEKLNEEMEFDHVIEVLEGGMIRDRPDLYAPELHGNPDGDETVEGEWQLMRGYTMQYGYNGPIMHNSEFIGGMMAQDILNTPGIYVSLVCFWDEDYCQKCEEELQVMDGDSEGDELRWALAMTNDPNCSEGGFHIRDEDRELYVEGWAVAFIGEG